MRRAWRSSAVYAARMCSTVAWCAGIPSDRRNRRYRTRCAAQGPSVPPVRRLHPCWAAYTRQAWSTRSGSHCCCSVPTCQVVIANAAFCNTFRRSRARDRRPAAVRDQRWRVEHPRAAPAARGGAARSARVARFRDRAARSGRDWENDTAECQATGASGRARPPSHAASSRSPNARIFRSGSCRSCDATAAKASSS